MPPGHKKLWDANITINNLLRNDKDRRTLDKNNDKNQTSLNHAKSEYFRKAYDNISTVLMVQSKSSAFELNKKQNSSSSKVQFTGPETERQTIGEKIRSYLSFERSTNMKKNSTVYAFPPIFTVWNKRPIGHNAHLWKLLENR